MNYPIVYLLLGFIIGYFLLILTTDKISYHGLNSNLVKQNVFIYGNKKIRFVPKIK